MKNKGNILLFFVIVLFTVTIDLYTKKAASRWLGAFPDSSTTVISGILKFTFTKNTGVVAGAFRGNNLFWTIFSAALIFFFLYLFFLYWRSSKLLTVSIALIVAGAAGNLFDRVFHQGVRDFIDFYTIGWPIFNIADAYLTLGVFGILTQYIFAEKKSKQEVDSKKPDASGQSSVSSRERS